MAETAPLTVRPAGALVGELTVPGDKSISHRAVMVGALNDEDVTVTGFGASADTLATVDAFRSMGVEIDRRGEDRLVISGVGMRGLREPDGPIDVRNAGTLMRILPGILAGQRGTLVLDGDESIRRRPMGRIAEPLGQMGVRVDTTDGLPPVTVHATGEVSPISFQPAVASAQVKSSVLFAGLFAEHGMTVVEEPIATRDHTERMLQRAGVPVDRRPGRVAVSPVRELVLPEIPVPGDFSSAAPFIAAATILQGSNLTIRDVSINPTRTGMLAVLERMGARVGLFGRRWAAGEPVADIEVRPAELVATDIEPELIPSLIDELPLLVLLASFARGTTTIRGAGELRVKESDRIATVVELLSTVGGRVKALEDGFQVQGVPHRLRGGRVDAAGDHRIAMLGAIAGVCSQEGVSVDGADALAVSFPDFAERLAAVSA
ncbi:MAG TPA: 3-phosphoshikimate 1-carboxyvinyltransferase [Gaiellales bacterium]|nr:3-phosphoshikimate 1-carboxyvinyltransferase [Gaiellales bacterium]